MRNTIICFRCIICVPFRLLSGEAIETLETAKQALSGLSEFPVWEEVFPDINYKAVGKSSSLSHHDEPMRAAFQYTPKKARQEFRAMWRSLTGGGTQRWWMGTGQDVAPRAAPPACHQGSPHKPTNLQGIYEILRDAAPQCWDALLWFPLHFAPSLWRCSS